MTKSGDGQGKSGRRRLAPGERVPLILNAAFDEFARRGYGATRIEAVANRAGIAKGLIYHYFPGKAELFKAVVHAFMRPVFEQAERELAEFEGPRAELLCRLVDIAYDKLASDPHERVLLRLLVAEGDRFPELTEFYHDEVLSRGRALIGAVIESGIARGEFRDSAIRLAPLVVIGPQVMATVWHLTFQPRHPLDLEALRAAHKDLILHGLLSLPIG